MLKILSRAFRNNIYFMNQFNMKQKKGAGMRRNTNGKLYTDENEYIQAFEAREKLRNETSKRKARGRPKKIPDYPQYLVRTYGEYIITFD